MELYSNIKRTNDTSCTIVGGKENNTIAIKAYQTAPVIAGSIISIKV